MSNTDSNGLKKHPKDENALGNESANESAAPVANGNEEVSENTEDGTRAAKKKELTDAVTQFAEISTKLGGARNAKAFFDIYGTDGFKPPKIVEAAKPASETEEEDEEKEKEKSASEKAAEKAKKLLKDHMIDTAIQDRSKFELGIPIRPPGYGATYMNHNWETKAIAGVDNPTTLKPEAWKTIADSNKIFHGFVVRDNGVLTRARFPAFELKPISGPDSSKDVVPHFEVFDASSISIKETSTEFERSMAHNGFTSTAIQASLAAGGWMGVGAGASMGFNKEEQKNHATGEFGNRKEYIATYSFPRARVFVDQLNLQLSSECAKCLTDIRDAYMEVKRNINNESEPKRDEAIQNALNLRNCFLAQFGHIFATSFQLGGQLTASKSAASLGTVSDESKRDAMKVSAALSLEAKFVSVSVSGSREKNIWNQQHSSDVNNTSALAWSARGGNTLLCANPSEWANSVASFQTWRTIEQEEIYPVPDLIGRIFDDKHQRLWSDIPTILEQIRMSAFAQNTWRGKMRLETNDGRRLNMVDNKVALMTDKESSNEVVFTVLDADIKKKDQKPRLEQLYADHPLFLVTGQTYARESQELGAQIPGLWADDTGSLRTERDPQRKICRWSLRPKDWEVDFTHPWTPDKTILQDGSEVKLYCHSYISGAYRTNDEPPYYAPAVMTKKNEATLRVQGFDPAYYKTHEFQVRSHWLESGSSMPNGDTTRTSMEKFDRGLENATQRAEITLYRKYFGTGNVEVIKSLFPRYPVDPSEKDSSQKAHTWWDLGYKIDGELWSQIYDWRSDSGFEDQVVFRVRYES